jgi:hypothetical protein
MATCPRRPSSEQQDRIVGEKSGRPRGKIKSIVHRGAALPAGQSGYAAARGQG